MSLFQNCAGMKRRDCLQLGLGALLGGTFLDTLRLRTEARADEGTRTVAKAKSCILIWMDGGPTHFETFAPKPQAPSEIRGGFETIDTAVPGVQLPPPMTT